MNTNRDVMSGSNLGMTSGSEVESAAFHRPVSPVSEVTVVMPERTGRLDHLKAKAHEAQRSIATRSARLKNNVRNSVITAQSTAKRRTSESVAKMQTSMQANPMKWAGIAAGSGLAIGLLGRLAQWQSRRHHHHHVPQLVVIETTC